MRDGIHYRPIGIFRHPSHKHKLDAPRQGTEARGEGVIELFRDTGIEHALLDLDVWPRLWLLFHFDRDAEFRPHVWPPRSEKRRGVLATRSPHRPNPIGLSAVRLLRVDHAALQVHVAEADLLDGTPVLDIKPYVAYADAFPDAGAGWLTPSDPLPAWSVVFSERAERALVWLVAHEIELRQPLLDVLSLGPTPQPYRRIKRRGTSYELAYQAFRADFTADEAARSITVTAIRSGYRPKQLESDPALELHRAFTHQL